MSVYPTEVNQTYEYQKDINGILAYPLSNQMLYIAANTHTFLLNGDRSITSNIHLDIVRSNIDNGVYQRVCLIQSNEWFINCDLSPYSGGVIDIGSLSQEFQRVYLKELDFGTIGCNVRIFRNDMVNPTSLQVSSSLYTNKIEIANTNEFLPVGSIMPFAGNILPPGYLWCDGSEVSKSFYAKLYQVVQDMYGMSTDGGKFKLPDFRSRSPLGATQDNPDFALNPSIYTSNYGGKETAVLDGSHLPSHQHIFSIKTTGGAVTQGSYGLVQQLFTLPLTDPTKFIVYETDTVGTGTEPVVIENSTSGFSLTTNSIGSGNPFTCVHPVLVTNFIIKY